MGEITAEMTVREILPLLSPAHRVNLQYWAAEFGIPLREFHLGHIKTYEMQRLEVESRDVVNAEVSTLLSLLESAGVGEEIRKSYQPLREPEELSPEERASLILAAVARLDTSGRVYARSPMHSTLHGRWPR